MDRGRGGGRDAGVGALRGYRGPPPRSSRLIARRADATIVAEPDDGVVKGTAGDDVIFGTGGAT